MPMAAYTKKLTVSPLEAENPGALDRQNEYLQAISTYPASKLRFFDESGHPSN